MSNPTQQELADAVKAHATEKYPTSYGWQVFIECYTNAEMLEFVEECRTVKEAIQLATDVADIQTERYQEARNEIL